MSCSRAKRPHQSRRGLLDETILFKYHISYICTRTSCKNGVIAKRTLNLTLSQLKQLHYSKGFPFISYAILTRESGYRTHIKQIQTKQNHAIKRMFFASTFGF